VIPIVVIRASRIFFFPCAEAQVYCPLPSSEPEGGSLLERNGAEAELGARALVNRSRASGTSASCRRLASSLSIAARPQPAERGYVQLTLAVSPPARARR
jgi:hypothetical protein